MVEKQDISKRRMAILRAVRALKERHGMPPSYRELMEAVGLKTVSAVSHHVQALQQMALLNHTPRVARSLTLTERGVALLDGASAAVAEAFQVVRFQIQGDIGASIPLDTGNGDFATYDEDDVIALDAASLPRRTEDLFAVRVRGHSMIDALIGDRDVVVLEKAEGRNVRDGEMVAAWLRAEQELTLKHYYLEGDRVRLQPANPTMGPIYSSAANVEVQGRVVAVIRQAN